MKKSILNLEGVEVLSITQRKNITGGRRLATIAHACVSSDTCSQGCAIVDDDGCSECSGCCIA